MGKFGDILLVSDFDRTLTNKEDEIPRQIWMQSQIL